MKSSRSASAPVFATASGRSANSPSISPPPFRWRSRLKASRRPAASSVVWWRRHVNTSTTPAASGVACEDTVGGEERQPLGARPVDQEAVPALLAGNAVALDLDVEQRPAEDPREPRARLGRGRRPALKPRAPHGALLVPGEGDEPLARPGKLAPGDAALALLRAQVRRRQEAAQAPVARPRGDEDRHDAAVLHRELGPDERPDARLLPGHVKPHGPVHAVAVAERQGRHPAGAPASATRASGSDPARRNENALRAWSST